MNCARQPDHDLLPIYSVGPLPVGKSRQGPARDNDIPKPKVAGSTPAGTANVFGMLVCCKSAAVTPWLQVRSVASSSCQEALVHARSMYAEINVCLWG